jgi:hypothetical protein
VQVVETLQQHEQCRLAAPGLADQADALTGLDADRSTGKSAAQNLRSA